MAVYTTLTSDQIADALRDGYGLSLVAAEPIAEGVENTNYLIVAGPEKRRYILTLFERRVQPAEVPFFMELMRHLAAKGIVAPQPIARRDGQLYGSIAGKPASMVSFLEGKSLKQHSTAQARAAGEALAKLHLAAADFTGGRVNDLALDGWRRLQEKLGTNLDGIEPGLQALVVKELDYLTAHWPRDLPRGVIHADYFPDNVFFTGDAVSGIIDFYFACNDLLAYDLAIALNAWCIARDGTPHDACGIAMREGYESVRPLTPEEQRAMPILLRGSALRFLLTRAHDSIHPEKGALVTPHDPREYIAKLKHHRGKAA